MKQSKKLKVKKIKHQLLGAGIGDTLKGGIGKILAVIVKKYLQSGYAARHPN